MGAPFSDITLYSPTPYLPDTLEYKEETALKNYVSDLYGSKMHGYKPPNTTRVTIQPGFYGIWTRTWKNGSIISIATEFIYDKFAALPKEEKYQYILDITHKSMLQLSEEYNWDKEVFERAYREVMECDFKFKLVYPAKQSKDRKKSAQLIIEKTETVTSMFIYFQLGNEIKKVLLLEKKNWWWYDFSYQLAKNTKWLSKDKFGVIYKPLGFLAWYDLAKEGTEFEINGKLKENFKMEQLTNY